MSRRIDRINELLLQEISRIVMERQHPDIGFVTFTGVKTTDDLMEAKVFYSVLGTEDEKLRTYRALNSMRHELLVSMRRLESLKYIPHFHFIYDETPSMAARVHDILDVLHQEPPVPPLPPEEAPLPTPSSGPSGHLPPSGEGKTNDSPSPLGRGQGEGKKTPDKPKAPRAPRQKKK